MINPLASASVGALSFFDVARKYSVQHNDCATP